jgi:hypothetical protein
MLATNGAAAATVAAPAATPVAISRDLRLALPGFPSLFKIFSERESGILPKVLL